MATPFDHLPKFQKLPSEVQKRIVDKFNQKSEQEQMEIMGKVDTPMSIRDSDPGLQDISTTPLTKSDFNAADVTEGLAMQGINPRLAKAVGTAFEMIPTTIDTALTVGGVASLAKVGLKNVPTLAEGAIKVGQVVKGGATEALDAVSGTLKAGMDAIKDTGGQQVAKLTEEMAAKSLADKKRLNLLRTAQENIKNFTNTTEAAVKAEAEAPVIAAKQQIKDLPLQQAAKREIAEKQVKTAGSRIGEVERDLKIDQLNVTPKDFRKFTDNPKKFADKYAQIVDNLGPDKMAENLDLKTIQTIRKGAENAAKQGGLDDATRNALYRIERVSREALAKGSTELEEAIGGYKAAAKIVEAMPSEFKQERQLLVSGLNRLQALSKEKVLTNAKLKQLENVTQILKRRSINLPAQFEEEKLALQSAITKAENLAAKQAKIRKRLFYGGVGVATASGLGIRKFL